MLWEFNDLDDPDLGYSYGQPQIRRMANGKWAAIFTGGYNNSQALTGETACTGVLGDITDPTSATGCTTSATGFAYLYIVYLSGPNPTDGVWTEGTHYVKLVARGCHWRPLTP